LGPADIVARVSGANAVARQTPEFSLIGAAMYDWMFPAGPLRQRWTVLQEAHQISVMLDVRDRQLAALPWELSSSPPPEMRVSSVGAMHRHEVGASRQCQCSPWPFRILFVVGCAEAEAVRLGVDQELEKIERTFVCRSAGPSTCIASCVQPRANYASTCASFIRTCCILPGTAAWTGRTRHCFLTLRPALGLGAVPRLRATLRDGSGLRRLSF
jgi:hypothetical protein